MTTITIASSVKEKFVLVPKKEYEQLLGLRKKLRTIKSDKKPYNVDESIKTALAEIERGETYGPFNTVKELMASLRSKD